MEPGSTTGPTRGRALRVALAIGLLASLLAPSGVALAQGTLTISTPYPAVTLQPGAPASFTIDLNSSEDRQVDLAVSGAPSGWTVALHGGGFTVDSVFVPKNKPPELKLDVRVPDTATQGATHLTVTATSGSLTARVVIDVTVAVYAGGTVQLTSQFPNLKGRSDQSYTFNLTLDNNTAQQLTFTVGATGGTGTDGWTISAQPSGQSQAASFAVDAGGSTAITVSVTPATVAPSGIYPIDVQAVSGTYTADQKVSVEITGNVSLSVAAPSGQPLSTTANAGSGTQYTLVVTNSGTSPATDITVAATPPSNWTVTFDSDTIASLDAGATQNVIATIKPAAEAIAGDYIVTFRASSADSTSSVDVRVTVETSLVWGIVGIAIIVLVLGGLVYVFQHYGRR